VKGQAKFLLISYVQLRSFMTSLGNKIIGRLLWHF